MTTFASKNADENQANFATGEWSHLFSVGPQETRCRILIDLASETLVAAQEWTGLKFEDIYGERLADLAQSVIDVNGAHKSPVLDYGLDLISMRPEWALIASESDPITSVNDAEITRDYTVIASIENEGTLKVFYARATNPYHAFGVVALREKDNFSLEFLVALPGKQIEGTDFDLPGEGIVLMETVLEQTDVFWP